MFTVLHQKGHRRLLLKRLQETHVPGLAIPPFQYLLKYIPPAVNGDGDLEIEKLTDGVFDQVILDGKEID